MALLLPEGPALAQADAVLAREVVAEVNGRLASLETARFAARRPGVDYRSDVRAWRDSGGIRKIEVVDPDDSGSVATEYYYRDRALVFAYVAIKGVREDGREVTRVEHRQYFRDGRLFQWLGGLDKVPVPSTDPEYAGEARNRLEASAFYVEHAQRAFAQSRSRS